jgi:biopolymer transport protein ExbD
LENPSDAVTREVNMTPLIDVSLVLVVMLLLMTPLAIESSLAVQRQQRASSAEQEDTPERVEIQILDEASIRVNRNVIAREELAVTLMPLFAGSAKVPAMVTCDDAVTHGTFVDVIDTAKSAGAGEIALAGT